MSKNADSLHSAGFRIRRDPINHFRYIYHPLRPFSAPIIPHDLSLAERYVDDVLDLDIIDELEKKQHGFGFRPK